MKKTPTSIEALKQMMAMDPEDLIPMPDTNRHTRTVKRALGGRGGHWSSGQIGPGQINAPCQKKTAKAKAERKRKKKHRRKNR